MKDCDAKRKAFRCLKSQRCASVSAFTSSGGQVQAHVKGCAAICSPSKIPVCNSPNTTCIVRCCSSDYCNGKRLSSTVPGPFPTRPTSVIPRQCYHCVSNVSFEDCDNKRTTMRCRNSQRCGTARVSGYLGNRMINFYVKGCAFYCSPSDIPACNHPNVTCELNCCYSDFCNGKP